jgi:hypothetical protein
MSVTEYSIETPQSPRPYFSRLASIAHDFEQWEYRKTPYPSNSEYIKIVKEWERKIKLASSSPVLLEVWGQEIVKEQQSDQAIPTVSPQTDTNLYHVSSMLQDLIRAIVT